MRRRSSIHPRAMPYMTPGVLTDDEVRRYSLRAFLNGLSASRTSSTLKPALRMPNRDGFRGRSATLRRHRQGKATAAWLRPARRRRDADRDDPDAERESPRVCPLPAPGRFTLTATVVSRSGAAANCRYRTSQAYDIYSRAKKAFLSRIAPQDPEAGDLVHRPCRRRPTSTGTAS
jgi:hypothetical protein